MEANVPVALIITVVLVLVIGTLLWKISRFTVTDLRSTAVYLCGDSRSGKTRLYYTLISRDDKPEAPSTVKTVKGAIYNGCIDQIPGKLLRLCDIPSDKRCHAPELLSVPPTVIVYIATESYNNADALDLLSKYRGSLKLFLILTTAVTGSDITSQIRKSLSADYNVAPEDVTVPACLKVAEAGSADEFPEMVLDAIRSVVCKRK